jgi:hypothetical protein
MIRQNAGRAERNNPLTLPPLRGGPLPLPQGERGVVRGFAPDPKP